MKITGLRPACLLVCAALLLSAAANAQNQPGVIDLQALYNYANQPIPNYINKDNTPPNNPLTDKGATLGRVLFYDKKLSVNNTVSCSSCHVQSHAFSDTANVSQGVAGTTGRHSMRLINTRFANETHVFWDERAVSVEDQATQPIKDHTEMGFSGTSGDPVFADLIAKMTNLNYYQTLFTEVYGDPAITEVRIQRAIAQFVRSIQSFDSKFDQGMQQAQNPMGPFPNFTQQENQGKQLFQAAPVFDPNGNRIGGGAGCAGCHQPPEFDIDPLSRNNGVIGTASGSGVDLTVTRAPSLRDLLNQAGNLHGGLMHDAGLSTGGTLQGVIAHYDQLPNTLLNPQYFNALDPKLRPNGHLQNLHLTPQESGQLEAFMATLTGNNVYTDPKWSNPFDNNGNLTVIPINVDPAANATSSWAFN